MESPPEIPDEAGATRENLTRQQAVEKYGHRIARTLGYFGETGADVTDSDEDSSTSAECHGEDLRDK
ncbi:hypothetical protein KJ996_03900 [Patescibacteria group bacterium]|nr:hypothetical protein [Patescibacteria group bacterium]